MLELYGCKVAFARSKNTDPQGMSDKWVCDHCGWFMSLSDMETYKNSAREQASMLVILDFHERCCPKRPGTGDLPTCHAHGYYACSFCLDEKHGAPGTAERKREDFRRGAEAMRESAASELFHEDLGKGGATSSQFTRSTLAQAIRALPVPTEDAL